MKTFPLLLEADLCVLDDALYYLHRAELKEICQQLRIPEEGKKAEVIHRIMVFIKTGSTVVSQKIPLESCARKGVVYSHHPDTKMMHGSYKNDAQTRDFFKQLIGNHFHFTVYGLDWLKERWMSKNPPTYAEFAQFWEAEYRARKGQQGPLKQEWAYMNFIRNHTVKYPHASKEEVLREWEVTRNKQLEVVKNIMKKVG